MAEINHRDSNEYTLRRKTSLLQERYNRISELLERSEITKQLDSYAEEAIIQHKRKHILKSLRCAIQLVLNSADKTVKIFSLKKTDVIIHSARASEQGRVHFLSYKSESPSLFIDR